jgi:hypothetical protein
VYVFALDCTQEVLVNFFLKYILLAAMEIVCIFVDDIFKCVRREVPGYWVHNCIDLKEKDRIG